MKKNRIPVANSLRGLRSPYLKLIIVTIAISFALLFVMGYIWKLTKDSGYFKIKEIVAIGNDAARLAHLKGKNIFSVDLREESGFILESYPEFSKVRLVKVLPNRILVYFISRKPIALVKLYKYFAVDEQGFLFSFPGQPQESGLPEVVGLETKIFGPQSGRKYNIKELALALNIIREIKKNRLPEERKIKKIDVANAASASVYFILSTNNTNNLEGKENSDTECLEIKIGQDDIQNKIIILTGLMKQAKNSLSSIKYIDLRFKDPVIKFKGN
jgi:hypothetical protein